MGSKDQTIGMGIFLACVLGVILYSWLIFLSEWSVVILKLTAFIAVAVILGMGAWIGWVMAKTPQLRLIDEIAVPPSESEIKKG